MNMLGYKELKEILPQAYPLLLIDRVEAVKKNESLVAVKNITSGEWPFSGANPPRFFPETLLIEAAAQAALVLYHLSKVEDGGPRPDYYLGRIKSEFFRPVEVGDEVRMVVAMGRALDDGGYSDIDLKMGPSNIGKVQLIYKVLQKR
jgi:3-hydroxyacyl-[acyl-carrier-protein] dehydratase